MGSVVQRVELGASDGDGMHRCLACGETFPADYRLCPRDGTALGPQRAGVDPLVGTVLGGTFRLLRPLARGGMARLYEAEHLRVARRFAVKVLSEAYADRPALVTRFEREARALAPLRSPHVVDVVDVLQTPDGRPCIVTGLLTGEDLGARLAREGALPVVEALHIALEMCRGLDAAHAHGVVHRDLKPSNVFLAGSPDGRFTVKLVDFGVAKLLADPMLTHTDTVVGTPAYMPPEQARSAAQATETSDVYGVGAVLYHMLSGRPPYTDGEPTEVLRRLSSEEPARLRSVAPGVPEDVETVVQAAMARDRTVRVATAAELHRLLTDLAHDHGGRPSLGAPFVPIPSDAPANQIIQDTVIGERGIVSDSGALAHRASRARARMTLTGLAAAAAMMTVGALLMATALAALRVDPTSTAHRWLVTLASLGTGAAGAWRLARHAHRAWPSAIAVESLRRRWTAGLVTGAAALGVCLALVAGAAILSGATPNLQSGSLGLATMVAGVAAGWASRPSTAA